MMDSKYQKKRAQVKSRWYYIFWGAATCSVFAGQLYVGTGYRRMAQSFDRIVNTVIIEMRKDWDPLHPMIIPPQNPQAQLPDEDGNPIMY